jgi:hypothetical protein
LYKSADGGRRWRHIAEPRKPLVRVVFTSPAIGFGLNLAGQLVETRDSGTSWRASGWQGVGVAMCATASGAVVLADRSNQVWRLANPNSSWRLVALGLAHHVSGFSRWWPDLSCQGENVVEQSQAVCEATCGGQILSRVRETIGEGGPWRVVLSQDAYDGGAQTRPSSALSLALERTAAIAKRGICLVGVPFYPPASLQISCRDRRAFQKGRLPRFPLPAKKAFVFIQGLDFLNTKTGWLVIDEEAAANKTQVWSTDDGGRVWTAMYTSARYR